MFQASKMAAGVFGQCYGQISSESSFYLKSDYFNAEPEANIVYPSQPMLNITVYYIFIFKVEFKQIVRLESSDKCQYIYYNTKSIDVGRYPSVSRAKWGNFASLYKEWCF